MKRARLPLTVLLTAVFAALTATPAMAAPSGDTSSCAQPGKKIVSVPWPQTMLDPQRAWPFATGRGVTVAVLDSGVDAQQSALHGHVETGADFLHGNGKSSGDADCVGHGTEVGGIIAGQPSHAIGFAGIAPGAKLLPVVVSEKEVLSDGKTAGDAVDPAGLADAVRWAVDAGADVINMSLVLYHDDPKLKSAIEYAEAKDVLVVAAVGNQGGSGDHNPTPYPAAYDGVLGVGAVGPDGTRADSSQHGRYVDVVAPGVQVVTTARGSGEIRVDGTSFATPFVAAVAALVRERYPRLHAGQVASRILATANPASGPVTSYGHGIVDPYRAVTEPLSSTAPRPIPALADRSSDPRAAARAEQRTSTTRLAEGLSAALLAAGLLIVLTTVVVRQGRRRGWSPLLTAPPPTAESDPTTAEPNSAFAIPRPGDEDDPR